MAREGWARPRRWSAALAPLFVVLAVIWPGAAGGAVILTADLTLAKSAPSSATLGSSFSYTLSVGNNGPDTGNGVVLTDNLPSQVSFGSVSSSQGSCSGGGTVSCALGSIRPKQTVTVTIGVTAQSAGTATNTASVSGKEPDPNTGNNAAAASTQISSGVDLVVQGTVTPEAVSPGGNLTYHATVKNFGREGAQGVQTSFAIPDRATVVSFTPSQGSCARGGPGVQCSLGTLGSLATATVDVVLRSTVSGDLPVVVTATSGGTDANPSNNAATLVGTVAEAFDLRVAMKVTPAKVGRGEWIAYTITATNAGPGAATGVKLVDRLPETVSFVSCQTTQGDCTSTSFLAVAAQTVQAAIGRLGAGDSANVKILARVTSFGTASNSVAVSGRGEGSNLLANNDATATTPIVRKQFEPPADLPPPVFKENVDVQPVSGTVKVRRPGSTEFETLAADAQLPLGTEFDTTVGQILLTSATNAQGAVQTAMFWDGFFVVTQATTKKVTFTDLALTRGDFSVCKGGRRIAAVGAKPPRKRKSTVTRKLWGRGQGSFRTKGKYSSAAVRGTYWFTADRCDGTFTSVRQGVVQVRDFVRRKSVTLRAGQSYLARPR
jgi:uncharacterized repeat protein (TIGR01451 family)